MQNTVYSDGVGSVVIVDGVVRLELVTISPDSSSKLERRSAGMLALSIPGVVRLHGELSKAIEKLVADGVLRKEDAGR